MSDILYLQADKNVQVHHPHVYLQDVVKLSCGNSRILNRLRVMPVADLDPEKPGRYVLNIMDLITEIRKKEPGLQIAPLGETDFILTYEKEHLTNRVLEWIKVVFVCLVSFFGTAFGIMTYNTDVSIRELFGNLYEQVTGEISGGFTILEAAYSVGIGLGAVFFFHHFGRKKTAGDPTPMQVKMRLYEDDVNTTIVEDASREGGAG